MKGGSERTTLLGGLTFMEGVASGWGAGELRDWFGTFSKVLHLSALPKAVSEPAVGSIALDAKTRLAGTRVATLNELPELLARTRERVAAALRGLLASPVDDRFLQAAIFSGRVRRESSVWIAAPAETHLLADIVLGLFAADVLSHREFYEEHLCVCAACGAVSFDPATTSRAGCGEHLPHGEDPSGVRSRRGSGAFLTSTPEPPPPSRKSGTSPVRGR
jgi:hypothetical protein